jgi:hypothetical protein
VGQAPKLCRSLVYRRDLGEAIGETREAPHAHPHREILALLAPRGVEEAGCLKAIRGRTEESYWQQTGWTQGSLTG